MFDGGPIDLAVAARPLRKGFLAWLQRCWHRRRQRRALARLDDRLLADIGKTRAEAAAECAKPFWR